MVKRAVRSGLVLVLFFLTMLLTVTPAAVAATSPGGVVDDRAGLFSAAELERLENDLTGRRFAFRVVILEEAFPDPSRREEVRFQEMAIEMMEQVPRDAVLITIAMKEGLVDFRVWKDGAVQSAFREATGRAFEDSVDRILDAFIPPASEGDVAGTVVRGHGRASSPWAAAPVRPAPSPGGSSAVKPSPGAGGSAPVQPPSGVGPRRAGAAGARWARASWPCCLRGWPRWRPPPWSWGSSCSTGGCTASAWS